MCPAAPELGVVPAAPAPGPTPAVPGLVGPLPAVPGLVPAAPAPPVEEPSCPAEPLLTTAPVEQPAKRNPTSRPASAVLGKNDARPKRGARGKDLDFASLMPGRE